MVIILFQKSLEHKESSAQRSRFLVSFALIDLAWCTITVILCSNACNNDQSSPMKMCFRTFYEALIVKKTFENTNSQVMGSYYVAPCTVFLEFHLCVFILCSFSLYIQIVDEKSFFFALCQQFCDDNFLFSYAQLVQVKRGRGNI